MDRIAAYRVQLIARAAWGYLQMIRPRIWRKPRRVFSGIPEDWHARYRAVIPRPGAHGQP